MHLLADDSAVLEHITMWALRFKFLPKWIILIIVIVVVVVAVISNNNNIILLGPLLPQLPSIRKNWYYIQGQAGWGSGQPDVVEDGMLTAMNRDISFIPARDLQGLVLIDVVCMCDKPNKKETGTAHKPLPKHPGKPQEPRTWARNFNLQQALLGKAQQTAKLSCRRGALPRLGGTAQPWQGALWVRTVARIWCGYSPWHHWTCLLQTSQIQPIIEEVHLGKWRGGRGKHAGGNTHVLN